MAISLDVIVGEMLEYTKHLPSDKHIPVELLVLKGHLLIERQLNALIECKVINPKALERARLTYMKKLYLVEALYGESSSISWGHVKSINSIRNSMAHELEDELITTKLDEFVMSVGGNKLKFIKGGLLEQLAYCLSHIHLELVKLREE